MRVFTSMALVILAFFPVSCGGESHGVPALVTWSVDTSPTLVIDSHGREPLYAIRDVAASPDRIAVADAGNHVVAIYDDSGHLLHTLGHTGRGPGEFEHVSNVFYLAGDSVLAFDGGLERFQVFDAEGGYARGFILSGDAANLRAGIPVALLDTGVIVARSMRPSPASNEGGSTRRTLDVLRFTLEGRVLDTVATVPGWEAYNATASALTNMPIPFSNGTYMDGAAGRFVLASTDSNELSVYSADGELLHSVRNVAPPGPAVTPAEIEAFKAQAIERGPAVMRQRLKVVYAEMPFPETKAPFSWVYAGTDSTIWLRLPQQSVDEDVFIVFDPAGKPVATITLPSAFSPMEVSRETVLGVWTDSLGVESVRAFRVTRRATNRR